MASYGMQSFGGVPVQIVSDQPKMRLREDLPLPEAFRAEINAWLAERFGYTNTMPDGQVYEVNNEAMGIGIGKTLLMNPRTFDQLMNAVNGVEVVS